MSPALKRFFMVPTSEMQTSQPFMASVSAAWSVRSKILARGSLPSGLLSLDWGRTCRTSSCPRAVAAGMRTPPVAPVAPAMKIRAPRGELSMGVERTGKDRLDMMSTDR